MNDIECPACGNTVFYNNINEINICNVKCIKCGFNKFEVDENDEEVFIDYHIKDVQDYQKSDEFNKKIKYIPSHKGNR